jgi:hypothetical protein
MKKIIWMSWLQGLDDSSIPKLNLECIHRWQSLNKDWDFKFITYKNVLDYVPDFFHILDKCPNRIKAHQTDLLRLILLEKFGGIWCDASLYPTEPLSNFIDNIVNHTDFFTYRWMPRSIDPIRGNRDTVVWFLAAGQSNHYLIREWRKIFFEKFSSDKEFKYFTMAESLCELYDSDDKIKHIINNMIQQDAETPHTAQSSWAQRKPSYMYKRPNLKND